MYNVFMDNNFEGIKNNSNPFGVQDEDIEFSFDDNDTSEAPVIAAGEHRLNDLDSNLFSESAYKGVDDEVFQLEYKINRTENKLKRIQSSIASASAINDFQQLKILNEKKYQYERELKNLYESYNSKGLSSRLSGGILNIVTKTPQKSTGIIQKAAEYLWEKVFSKLSDRFDSALYVKDALIKLENINKNVDDLVSMQTPYGEASEKYVRLLQYLNKANTIQYQISQMVNDNKRGGNKSPEG